MSDRFSERAIRAVVLAQVEARMLNHDYIGTEHILLGLLTLGRGVAAMVLESLTISPEVVRQRLEDIIGQGPSAPTGPIPFTPPARNVLRLALREARDMGHPYAGTGHLLIGLLVEREGVAAQVLSRMGAHVARVREEVVVLLAM